MGEVRLEELKVGFLSPTLQVQITFQSRPFSETPISTQRNAPAVSVEAKNPNSFPRSMMSKSSPVCVMSFRRTRGNSIGSRPCELFIFISAPLRHIKRVRVITNWRDIACLRGSASYGLIITLKESIAALRSVISHCSGAHMRVRINQWLPLE